MSVCRLQAAKVECFRLLLSVCRRRVTSDDYIKYNFKDTMDTISDVFNYKQIELECEKKANEFLQKEIEIIQGYFSMKSTRMLVELARTFATKKFIAEIPHTFCTQTYGHFSCCTISGYGNPRRKRAMLPVASFSRSSQLSITCSSEKIEPPSV